MATDRPPRLPDDDLESLALMIAPAITDVGTTEIRAAVARVPGDLAARLREATRGAASRPPAGPDDTQSLEVRLIVLWPGDQEVVVDPPGRAGVRWILRGSVRESLRCVDARTGVAQESEDCFLAGSIIDFRPAATRVLRNDGSAVEPAVILELAHRARMRAVRR